MNTWTETQLMIHRAELNLNEGQMNFDQELTDYKNNLIIYKYEQALIQQKLDTSISPHLSLQTSMLLDSSMKTSAFYESVIGFETSASLETSMTPQVDLTYSTDEDITMVTEQASIATPTLSDIFTSIDLSMQSGIS